MGLFSSLIHIYQKSQEEVVKELSREWKEHFEIATVQRMDGDDPQIDSILGGTQANQSVDYLVTKPHGNWTTIIEINTNVKPSFYPSSFVKSLSRRLNTYALSIHLHDSDVLYYNLEKQGHSIGGYKSDYPYFLSEPAERGEILGQQHNPATFTELLPSGKSVDGLSAILNEGYYDAFANDDLDEHGIPIEDDKYVVDEHERFEKFGKYLEFYSRTEYPFVDWYGSRNALLQQGACLLRGQRNH